MRCEANPEVDVRFADRMDEVLMGNTDAPLEPSVSATSASSEKKRAFAAIADISSVAMTIADEMKETNRLAQEQANEMKEKNRLAKQSQIIALAQHLGKQEILEQMLATLSSTSGNLL
jgi:FtsZ-binding cell division protein ZapB